MGKHALLSASSSKRWLSCTPSARLEEQFRDEPGGSVYAEEGTAAHALAEHKLKKALKRSSKRPVSDYHCDEMEECTDGYVAFAMEQVELARQECADPVVLIDLTAQDAEKVLAGEMKPKGHPGNPEYAVEMEIEELLRFRCKKSDVRHRRGSVSALVY